MTKKYKSTKFTAPGSFVNYINLDELFVFWYGFVTLDSVQMV